MLVGRKEDQRPDVLSRVLAAFRGVTALDATMAVRRSRGILAEGLDRARAEDLASRLAAAGIGARVVAADGLAILPPVRLLARAAPGPDGLRVTVRGEGETLVPWERLVLVAVAPWQETLRTKARGKEGPSGGQMAMRVGVMAVTGLPMGLGKKKAVEKTVTKTEFRLVLDLHLRAPADLLRVDAAHFDFSGLGKAMAYSAHGNMRALLEGIWDVAPGAATSPGADLLLLGGRLTSLGYESLDDFSREERWLMTVLRG